ncbi:MAG: outer membrane lipid asymmetry maintenance protein MlaD [Steroidobacteraceae bacterium]
MRANRSLEIGTGLFVLLGLAALLFLSMQLPANGLKFSFSKPVGYDVTAQFDNIGSLKVGAPVRMAGVRIGQVTRIDFDTNTERAKVWLLINPHFNQIPMDSSASIDTEGLLGGQYISISPGGMPTYLKAGSEIIQTQSALVLENLINKFFANFASKSGSKSSGGGAKEQK